MKPKMRIMLATPNRGTITPGYMVSLYRLAALVKDAEFELDMGTTTVDMGRCIEQMTMYDADVVRARSRMVRHFLESDCTHLLFVDSDITFDIPCIAGLIMSDKDVVGACYPRRHILWDKVYAAAREGKNPEAAASSYAIRLKERGKMVDNLCEVDGIGLGMTLIKRHVLQSMVDAYRDELWFRDDAEGGAETVAIFQLAINSERLLLTEDYSFCERLKAQGFKTYMYLGVGSPVDHSGIYTFKGFRDGVISSATE